MATMRHLLFSRVALRLALAAGAAASISGCADSSRLASDPFSDPFGGSTKVARAGRPIDNVSTGSIPGSSPAPVQSQPLAPPSATASAASGPAGYDHWTGQGGTPVTVAEGETAEIVANRYGVPTDVLVRTNGFSSASEVSPGSRVVIPVYRGQVATAPKPAPAAAPARQVAEAPKPAPAPAAPVSAKLASAPANAKVASVPAKPGHAAPVAPAAKPVAQAKPVAPAKPQKVAAKPQPAAPAKPLAVAQKAAPAPVAPKAPAAAAAAPATVAAAAPPPAAAPAPAAPPKVAAAAPQQNDEPSEKVGSGAHPEFRWPARGRVIQNFASGGNDGINIALPEGTQVKAAESGVVAYAGNGLKGYGNLVLIKHPNGFVSAYAHNGELSVKAGDQVTRGQTIAKSGQSGDVPTPQLHFELRKGKTPVDPMGYLASL